MSNLKGVFITFEGGEGCGKSTQCRLLVEALNKLKIDVMPTREPGGTLGAEQIRSLLIQRDSEDWDPVTEVLLLQAARREHLQKRILPALEKGQWVISDRFIDSTRVYQGYARELGLSEIDMSYKMIAGDIEPEVTFVFDIPVELGLERSNKQLSEAKGSKATEDKFERLGADFHEKVRQGFLDIAAQYPNRCVIIDASGGIEDIHQEVINILKTKFDLSNGTRKTAANGN